MPRPVAVKAAEIESLDRGTRFSVRLPKSLTHAELHRVFYRTANREVVLTLRDGSKVTGRLVESPGFFARDQRVWLRVPGRVTRKGVKTREVRHLVGYKAPTLAEAYTALVGATSGNPSPELVAETRSIIADM